MKITVIEVRAWASEEETTVVNFKKMIISLIIPSSVIYIYPFVKAYVLNDISHHCKDHNIAFLPCKVIC